MNSYKQLLQDIMDNGEVRKDRTGVGTIGIFGYQWFHDMENGFPLVTTKKVHFHSILIELLWFLEGRTNVRWLQQRGCRIWDEWADENGDLGPIYGKQWRNWVIPNDGDLATEDGGIDQIFNLVEGLKHNPFSRRHIVTAWNPADVPHMKLPPCHTLWQCHVSTKNKLNLHLYARSIDAFLGLPFNIASYALLLSILAQVTQLKPGELVISFGDLHIYSNHVKQVHEQLSREPKQPPILQMDRSIKAIDGIDPDQIKLIGYEHHPLIKAPIAV